MKKIIVPISLLILILFNIFFPLKASFFVSKVSAQSSSGLAGGGCWQYASTNMTFCWDVYSTAECDPTAPPYPPVMGIIVNSFLCCCCDSTLCNTACVNMGYMGGSCQSTICLNPICYPNSLNQYCSNSTNPSSYTGCCCTN